jgi:hypothetical protein
MPPKTPPPSKRAGVGQPTPASQPVPALQPTLAEPPAAPLAANTLVQPQAKASARPSTRRAVRAKVVHGQIAQVHATGGYATVDFPDDVPAAGSRASVYRRQLFQRKHLGDVEIFVNPAGQLCIRPQGRLKIGELAIEDELIVLPQIADGDHDLEAAELAPQL